MLLLLSQAFPVRAQQEANIWYFGDRAGFDFRQGVVQPLLDGQLATGYSCAVMSDKLTGQLLFYSNGKQVWNRAHELMPTGQDLKGSPLTPTQGALIVPVPGQAQQYYLFTLLQRVQPGVGGLTPGASQLFYSLVDMRLAGGQGDVVASRKNVALAGQLTEKLTAVRHTNGRDYWVLVHEWGSDAFLVYAVTEQGVGLPVRQRIGPPHPALVADTVDEKGTSGQLQASPDGRRLACTIAYDREPFSLFDFDATSGQVSNYVNLGVLRDAFGVCFSPDNTKLYVQNFLALNRGGYNVISQYDLTAGDGPAIAASGQSIVAGNPTTNISATGGGGTFYTLQNAPDGRLYGASLYRGPDAPAEDTGLQTLFVVNKPNARGFASDVNYRRFEFGGRVAGPGLPNFMQHYFNGLEPRPSEPDECALSEAVVFPNPASDFLRVQFSGACSQPYSLAIYDAVGRLVLTQLISVATREAPVRIAQLAAGLYLVELRSGQQRVVRKLIKH